MVFLLITRSLVLVYVCRSENAIPLNIGPQHPSTHGVPRCISILHGEIIQYIITEIGLLHRGTEKLIAINSNPTNISYFDRLDYIPVVTQEPLFLQTLELLVGCNLVLIVPL